MNDYSYIDRNVAEIRERIKRAEASCGREGEVMLLAAVKYAEAGEIEHLRRIGIRDIGENRVQQLLEHYEGLNDRSVNIHFIGTLQTNKVKYIVDKVCMIHSVDSLRLAQEIQKQCEKRDIIMDVLVEINSGREENKTGVLPEEAEALCLEIAKMPNLRLRGFMTMAPKCQNDAEYEKYFNETYNLIIDIWKKKLYNIERPIISMGMSGSFEAAVRCGSTCVRVGSLLFAE